MAPHAARHATGETRAYERHRPEDTVLYRSIREHWPEFLERAEEAGGLPRFVVREVEEYMRCGLLEHGCVGVGCCRCGFEPLVAFSCKRRGFCPSCLGRRMADTAVHLVEEVIPEVPVRQWPWWRTQSRSRGDCGCCSATTGGSAPRCSMRLWSS